MPKGKNQKLKLYYLAQILIKKTDDEHALTLKEIQDELLEYDVTADRKSLYDDMEAMRIMGIDVVKEKAGNTFSYHVANKQFEIAELKLLVDAIQGSKFITEKKSNELIKKVTELASHYEAEQLRRQVVVTGRIKSMNESIYYNVDEIHNAIAMNRMICFEYLRWNLGKKLEPYREAPYRVSPWALTWDDENYYLIAYDEDAESIKHFRVDKMRRIAILEDKRRSEKAFREFDIVTYARKSFGMYGGTEQTVRLQFENGMVGVLIDRFGKDLTIRPVDKDHSVTNVNVVVSEQFFGWIFALGSGVKIIGPEDVVQRFKERTRETIYQYESAKAELNLGK